MRLIINNWFLIIIGLSSPLSILSQEYIPMNFEQGVWIEWYFEKGGYEEKIQHYCKGDTSIASYYYHKLYETKIIYPYIGFPDTIYENYIGGIRENESKQVLLMKESNSDSSTIIYDFNLTVGDTIQGAVDQFIINVIDSVEICGRFHKRYIQFLGTDQNSETLVEGVGFSNGLLGYYNIYEAMGETTKWLECFSERDNQDCSPCNYITGIIENLNKVSIYPNPVTNTFTVESPKPISQIKIITACGIEVLSINCYLQKRVYSSLKNCQNGFYVMIVQFEDLTNFSSIIIKRSCDLLNFFRVRFLYCELNFSASNFNCLEIFFV